MNGEPAITGCGVVSTAGVGMAALHRHLTDPPPAAPVPAGSDAEGSAMGYPPLPVRPVADIPLTDHVGRKGTRRLDRMIKMALVGSRDALASADRPTQPADGQDWRETTGVTIATSTGSIRSLAEIAADTLTQDEPWMIAPSRFPNTVLNSSAGQIAIWNRLRGVNATVAGGQLSGISALQYAATMIGGGHVRGMLTGGVEELGPHLAWAWHRAGSLERGASLGEGCVLLMLEAPDAVEDRRVLAHLVGTDIAYCGARRGGLAEGLTASITRLLERSGLGTGDIDVVALGSSAQLGVRRIEERGVRAAVGDHARRLLVSDGLGETYSAAGSFQVAALLAQWDTGSAPQESHALVTAVDRDGNVGCAVLRRARPSTDLAGGGAAADLARAGK